MYKYFLIITIGIGFNSVVFSQSSLSVEHIFNNSDRDFTSQSDFLSSIGANVLGYQCEVYNNIHGKAYLGGRKIESYSISPVDAGSIFQYLYGIDLRYDIIPLIFKKGSRIKLMPLISYMGSYQDSKDYEFPDKKSYHKFSVGAGIDFRLIKQFGLTGSFYHSFDSDSPILSDQFQLGINYEF